MPNLELVKVNLILDGFTQADIRPSTLVTALRDKKKDHFSDFGKTISTIKDYVADFLHIILEDKTTLKI